MPTKPSSSANPQDIVAHGFGDGLPKIRPWAEQHFEFSGYVLAPDAAPEDRTALRAQLGFLPDEPVCVVTVGGSGVGTDLLRRVIDALPHARERVPRLRVIAVFGPRIDPASPPARKCLEVLPYVDRLSRHLAACDAAVVRGGLTTCMELAAANTPFLYFPGISSRTSTSAIDPSATTPDERRTTPTRHPRPSEPRSQTRCTAPAKPTRSNAMAPNARAVLLPSCSSRPAAGPRRAWRASLARCRPEPPDRHRTVPLPPPAAISLERRFPGSRSARVTVLARPAPRVSACFARVCLNGPQFARNSSIRSPVLLEDLG